MVPGWYCAAATSLLSLYAAHIEWVILHAVFWVPLHWLDSSVLTSVFFLFRGLFRFCPPRESRIASARAALFGSEFGSPILPPFRTTHFPKCYRVRVFFVHSILYAHTHLKNQEENHLDIA